VNPVDDLQHGSQLSCLCAIDAGLSESDEPVVQAAKPCWQKIHLWKLSLRQRYKNPNRRPVIQRISVMDCNQTQRVRHWIL